MVFDYEQEREILIIKRPRPIAWVNALGTHLRDDPYSHFCSRFMSIHNNIKIKFYFDLQDRTNHSQK